MRNKLQVLPILTLVLLSACDRDAAEEKTAEAGSPAAAAAPALERTPAPDGARVFFITPAAGDTVSNPVRVEFGIEGMSVARAGENVPDSGHHHLLIDAPLPDVTRPIPADANYVHFGDASTSTELTLEPGPHTLQLLLGDHLHIPHDPPVASEVISITVE